MRTSTQDHNSWSLIKRVLAILSALATFRLLDLALRHTPPDRTRSPRPLAALDSTNGAAKIAQLDGNPRCDTPDPVTRHGIWRRGGEGNQDGGIEDRC